MKPQPEPSSREVLAGLVERVTYHNDGNGYCVLRIKARGHRELVTVVGHAAVISAGEWITASGEWVNDRTHGQQFKARFLRTSAPTSTEGIEKYLSSGMIRGIGPVYARKLVRALSEKVFDVIEAERDRLREVDGIGPVRAQQSGMQRCRSAVGPVSGAFPAASSGMQSSLACSTRDGPNSSSFVGALIYEQLR
jgi:exodeoxyribonuclease V alpha subunit